MKNNNMYHKNLLIKSFRFACEAVKLNMNGTIFSYGTATPPAQRAEQEAQVNKIIKTNLPQELSRYFYLMQWKLGTC